MVDNREKELGFNGKYIELQISEQLEGMILAVMLQKIHSSVVDHQTIGDYVSEEFVCCVGGKVKH